MWAQTEEKWVAEVLPSSCIYFLLVILISNIVDADYSTSYPWEYGLYSLLWFWSAKSYLVLNNFLNQSTHKSRKEEEKTVAETVSIKTREVLWQQKDSQKNVRLLFNPKTFFSFINHTSLKTVDARFINPYILPTIFLQENRGISSQKKKKKKKKV